MFDDNSKKVVIDFKRRYSNTMYQWDYSYSEINYLTSQKNIWLSSSKYRSIQIKDKYGTVGEIFLADIIWNNDIKAYKLLKAKLIEIYCYHNNG